MSNSRLIILNTIVSYGRSLLSAGLTLFSTRWVLGALGKADYGLYFAVGGVIVFLGFVNTSMALTSQRYLAYAVGHGGAEEVNEWFNVSLLLHLVLALVFVVLAIPVGWIAFKWFLTIPDGRLMACRWVYVASVAVAFFSVVSVPYSAVYIARQHIYELTIIQMLQTILLFVLSWCLLSVPGDRLIVYAFGTAAINSVVYLLQIIRCWFVFPESKINLGKFSEAKCKALLSFSGWSLASTFGFLVRGQGIAMLLNNFGTIGSNAAYSIANNISSQTSFLANGFMNAISPEINSTEGAGKREDMIRLATQSSKFAMTLVLFIVLPLYSDVEALLEVWLKEVPEYTAAFVRVIMIMFVSIQAVLGVSVANKAFGKIALPQSLAAGFLALAIPLGYLAIKLDLSLVYVVGAVSVTQLLCALSTLFSAYYLFKYPVLDWLRQVLGRNLIVVSGCVFMTIVIHLWLPTSFSRFVLVAVADAVAIIVIGYVAVLTAGERRRVVAKLLRR